MAVVVVQARLESPIAFLKSIRDHIHHTKAAAAMNFMSDVSFGGI